MISTERLIFVAGPSGAGKTTLLNRWWSDETIPLRKQMQIGVGQCWSIAEAQQIPALSGSHQRQLLLHFDFYAQHLAAGGFRFLAELIDGAKRVEVLTLCSSSRVLASRIESRLQGLIDASLSDPVIMERSAWYQEYLRQTCNDYSCDGFVSALYDEWLQCVDEFGVDRHWLLDSTEPQLPPAIQLDISQRYSVVGRVDGGAGKFLHNAARRQQDRRAA